jgi:hypothetical protein
MALRSCFWDIRISRQDGVGDPARILAPAGPSATQTSPHRDLPGTPQQVVSGVVLDGPVAGALPRGSAS